eukprot:14547685-Alexandrium_andersonii.AAC.1
MASKFAPEVPEGCVLRNVSRRHRICRREWLAGAPEALLRGSGGAEPPWEALKGSIYFTYSA